MSLSAVLRVGRLVSILALLLAARGAMAQPLVAPTEPVSAAEQQKRFKLPPGFEIELVAAEPDIHKPMNLKFDARGRLWVTHSIEYPFAAASDEAARDAITIFPGATLGSRPEAPIRFAEHLNIPIGVLPLDDRRAVAWSIPNLYQLTDSDGDGRADERGILFGPFGVKDTHGDQNGLTRWIDGWVYANHGFANHSEVKARGQGEVLLTLDSGNVYRFRPDGTAIEQFAWGQVNPFGLCFDPLGNLFTADCHSRAVSMILREGYYSSFGKPHDGLGFAPDTTDIDHGGSGIAAVSYYAADQFPEAFRGVLFIGNVVTGRVHCDRLVWHGSSPRVERSRRFSDLRRSLVPTGRHSARARRGTVCRRFLQPDHRPLRSAFDPSGPRPRAGKNLAHRLPRSGTASRRQCGGQSARHAGTRRFDQARRRWTGRFAGASEPDHSRAGHTSIAGSFRGPGRSGGARVSSPPAPAKPQPGGAAIDPDLQRAHALWIVQRTAGLGQDLSGHLAGDPSPLVRVHLVQALGATAAWQAWHFELVRGRLGDADPFVRRAAATALAQHPASDNIGPLTSLLAENTADDPQLIHAARIALRDQIRDPAVAGQLASLRLGDAQWKQFLAIAPLVPSATVAMFLYDQALAGRVEPGVVAEALPAAAQAIDPCDSTSWSATCARSLPRIARGRFNCCGKFAKRSRAAEIPASDFTIASLVELLGPTIQGDDTSAWTDHQVDGAAASESPWVRQPRRCKDGPAKVATISSLRQSGGGERLTGVLRAPCSQFRRN